MLRFIVLASLLGCLTASPVANQYFETVLHNSLQNEIRALSLDPASISDFTTEFKDKVAFIDVNGKANYTNGNITGLSRSRRHYECMGPYYAFGAVNVNCTISLYDLKTSYTGKVKYGKLPVVSIKARANVTESLLFVEVTGVPPNNIATIKNLHVTVLGQIETTFTGLGPLNKHMKVLEDGYKAHVTSEIFNTIQQRFTYAFGRAVSQVPLPR